MILNHRHKTILFITLVIAGCALLLDADLKSVLGFLMLGAAAAWAIGSGSAEKQYSNLRNTSGRFLSLIRLPLAMSLAGVILGAGLLFSRANPVLAIGTMCACGVLAAPFRRLPTRRLWLKALLCILAGSAFVVGIGVPFLIGLGLVPGLIGLRGAAFESYTRRAGELVATGFIAFLLGLFWITKGWTLIIQGITNQPALDSAAPLPVKGSAWRQYAALALGISALTFWLSLLALTASSSWAYAPDQAAAADDKTAVNNIYTLAAFTLLLASAPYASWKRILAREPNTDPQYLRRHQLVTAMVGMTFATVLGLAITIGIQNGQDRSLTREITTRTEAFKAISGKIGSIRRRTLETPEDYVRVYADVEPLLQEYDARLEDYYQSVTLAAQRDKDRGSLNIQRLYISHKPNVWPDALAMIALLREVGSLARQEVVSINAMAALPAAEQVDFWNSDFRPLLTQEDALREKITALQKRQSPLR